MEYFLKDGKRYGKGMEPVYLFKTIILEHKIFKYICI